MVFRNLRERFCIDDQDYQVDANEMIFKKTTDFQAKELPFACLCCVCLADWDCASVCSELSDEERAAQQRLSGSLRQPLPDHLRPPLCNQNRVQRRHSRDAQHTKEISPGGSPTAAPSGRHPPSSAAFTFLSCHFSC